MFGNLKWLFRKGLSWFIFQNSTFVILNSEFKIVTLQKKIYKMLKPNLNELGKLAKDTHIETKKYFDKLKKKTPKNLDYVMQDLHDAEFKKTECLECAN